MWYLAGDTSENIYISLPLFDAIAAASDRLFVDLLQSGLVCFYADVASNGGNDNGDFSGCIINGIDTSLEITERAVSDDNHVTDIEGLSNSD